MSIDMSMAEFVEDKIKTLVTEFVNIQIRLLVCHNDVVDSFSVLVTKIGPKKPCKKRYSHFRIEKASFQKDIANVFESKRSTLDKISYS